MTFHYVENVQDVWQFALTSETVDHPVKFDIEDDNKNKDVGNNPNHNDKHTNA